MNPKLLRCLALTLFCGLFIAFISRARFANWLLKRDLNQNTPVIIQNTEAQGTWGKKLKAPWMDTKVILYRPTGEAIQVDAKEAVYTVWSTGSSMNQPKPFDVPAVAFIDPATSNVWIGGVNTGQVETNAGFGNIIYTNLYVETGSEIIRADNVIFDGIFDWDESVIKRLQPGEGLDVIIDRVDKKAASSWLFHHVHWEARLSDYFRSGFFRISGWKGDTEILQAGMTNGTLQLDFASPEYKTKGRVWLNLGTPNVVKAVEYQ